VAEEADGGDNGDDAAAEESTEVDPPSA
jgi:hypothetical protein